MRALVVRCPQCGASLDVQGDATSVRCTYCDTTARVQTRSRVLQVPRTVDADAGPVARQRFSWVALLPFAALLAMVGFGVVLGQRSLGARADRQLWAGASQMPVLADVDGDGIEDVLGIVRHVMKDDRAHLVAHNGATGAQLWESPSLGTFSSLGSYHLAVRGGLVLLADDRGRLTARDARTAAVRWTLAFDEKIDDLCAGAAPGELVVLTADGHTSIVDAAGSRRAGTPLVRLDRSSDRLPALFFQPGPVAAPELCVSISGRAWQRIVGLLSFEPTFIRERVEIDGMRVERLARRPGGPVVAIGAKQPGTPVGLVTRLDDQRAATWRREIPAIDPLVSRFDDQHVTLTDTAVLALYAPPAPARPRVTSIDLATGERRWDVALPGGSTFTGTGLRTTGDLVLVTSWTGVWALGLADGRVRYVLGAP